MLNAQTLPNRRVEWINSRAQQGEREFNITITLLRIHCMCACCRGTEQHWHITCCWSTPAGFWSPSLFPPLPWLPSPRHLSPTRFPGNVVREPLGCVFVCVSPGFTESFSRTEMVGAALPSPTPSIHVSAWRYMPSDLRRSLTRRPIRWLLLAWRFITNTVAEAHSTAVYAFNP